MIRLSPCLLIAAAGAMVGVGKPLELRAVGKDRDRLLPDAVKDVEPVRPSWDVQLIQHCGHWSHFDYRAGGSAWPVTGARTSPELGAFGAEHQVMHDRPQAGDILLQYGPRQRCFVHAGIVVTVVGHGRRSRRVPYYDLIAIEGDTDERGRLHGGAVMRVKRRMSPAAGDRFLRWCELESIERFAARERIMRGARLRRSA